MAQTVADTTAAVQPVVDALDAPMRIGFGVVRDANPPASA